MSEQKQNEEQQNEKQNYHQQNIFEATLHPVTSRYIQSKYKQINENQYLGQVDLRNMCHEVVQELEQIEKSAAYDYLKVENEMIELNQEIEKSDQILEDLENVLINFRTHLNEIKSEMTSLQDKSLKMNTSLTNRKHLQKLLGTFMDSAVLDPKLIDSINDKPIDENYVEHIKILCQKLEYLKNTQLSDATAVKELEPELNKLKNKACGRVRLFLLDKIEMLKKPMTNITFVQKSVLLKFKIFTEFLKEHYLEIYVEMSKNYAEVMSKIYLNKFKAYVREIEKLLIELYNKHDTILCDNTNYIRNTLNFRGNMSYQLEQRSIFYLMKRDEQLKQIDQDVISFHIATQKQQRFLVEDIFKSINKIVLDSVVSEVLFTQEFFNLDNKQNNLIFGGVFKQTFNFLFDYFRDKFQETYDINGILLIILINEMNKKYYCKIIQNALDYYFDQVNIIIWPRFEQLFESHLKSVTNCKVIAFKQLERQFEWKPIFLRYVDLQVSLYKLYSYFDDNRMLSIRLSQLRNAFHTLITKSAEEIKQQFEKIIYLLKIYDLILMNFNQCIMNSVKKEFQEDIHKLETEINKYIDEYIQIYMNEYFLELMKFVKTYCQLEEIQQKGQSDQESDQDEIKKQQQQLQQQNIQEKMKLADNAKLVDNICQEINLFWNKKTETFKIECEKFFTGTEVLKKILKKFMNVFMAYYGSFNKYLRTNYPNNANNMIKIHEMMREIQKSYGI